MGELIDSKFSFLTVTIFNKKDLQIRYPDEEAGDMRDVISKFGMLG